MNKYILFDTETGGHIEKGASLLSLHALELNSKLEITNELSLYTKPNSGVYTIQPGALKINQIDLVKHDKKAISYREAKQKLINFVALGTDLTPVGHNTSFDVDYIKMLIGREEYLRHFSYRTIDTAAIAKFLILAGKLPKSIKTSLSGLAEYFSIPVNKRHEAKAGCYITLQVLKHLLMICKKEEEGNK